jgi:hypothetical protein
MKRKQLCLRLVGLAVVLTLLAIFAYVIFG